MLLLRDGWSVIEFFAVVPSPLPGDPAPFSVSLLPQPKTVKVFGSVGFIAGDSMEHLKTTRQTGIAAIKGNKSFWTDRDERTKFFERLMEPDLLKRRDSVDIVVQQIRDTVEQQLLDMNERKLLRAFRAVANGDPGRVAAARAELAQEPKIAELFKAAQKDFGIRAEPCPLEGLGLDMHMITLVDVDHMCSFGIGKLLLEKAYETLSVDQKAAVSVELQLLDWPRNALRPTFDFSVHIKSRYSMHYVNEMVKAGVVLFRGRCHVGRYRAVCVYFRLRNALLNTHRHTDDTRARCLALTRELITVATEACGPDVMNKPNVTHLITLIIKDLKMVPNAHLFRTQQFERKNKSMHVFASVTHDVAGAKEIARGHNEIQLERAVLEQQELESTVGWLLRGGIYIKDDKPTCWGGALRLLRDGRAGREHLPFPAVQQLTAHWQPLPAKARRHEPFGNGLWDTAQMLYHQWSSGTRSGRLETDQPSATELKLLQQALERDWHSKGIDLKACTFEYPVSFVSTAGDRRRRLRLSDHVTVQIEDKKTQVVRLDKAVTLILPSKESVTYIFASWFLDTGVDELTDIRLVRPLASRSEPPFMMGALVEQVMVQHRCKYECKRAAADGHDPANCEHRCRAMLCCPAHKDPDCKVADCLKSEWHNDVVHNRRDNIHFVFEHDTGFVPNNEPMPFVDANDTGM